jgi:hypothetical protein
MAGPSSEAWANFLSSSALLETCIEAIRYHHMNKWVVIYKGEVEVVADSFDDAINELAKRKIPASESIIRFMGQCEPNLIL